MECFSIRFVLTLDIDMSLDVQNPQRLNKSQGLLFNLKYGQLAIVNRSDSLTVWKYDWLGEVIKY